MAQVAWRLQQLKSEDHVLSACILETLSESSSLRDICFCSQLLAAPPACQLPGPPAFHARPALAVGLAGGTEQDAT